MKTFLEKKLSRISERGQAIVLIIFAFIGLVAMVGLVTDTGLLMIGYGRLKRGVDAAAVAAAQEFRPDPDTGVLNTTAMENAARGMLQINQIGNISNIIVHTCEDTGANRPTLCNPDPIGNPIENRKLVEVSASAEVPFGFLRVIGINGATLNVSSIGEAATIDLVLLIDTSGSMAYQTSGNPVGSDPGDDPRLCNAADTCEPMRAVKDVAMDFVDSLIYFGYDRVAVIAMTGQAADINDAVERDPIEVMPLSYDRNTILNNIDNLKVFQPRICDGSNAPGECLKYNAGVFEQSYCEIFQSVIGSSNLALRPTADPSSCPSSNIGGMLDLARGAYSGSGDPDAQRDESLWVTVLLASGPTNASTPSSADMGTYPFGYCPQNTWLSFAMPNPRPKQCRDADPGNERSASDPLVSYTNPLDSNLVMDISLYDAEDYARDMADNLAAMKSGNGVTIYSIGLGDGVVTAANGTPAVTCEIETTSGLRICGEAEYLLTYISRTAGDALNADINHGEYFFAPNNVQLRNIFEIIAQNIATKISQ
jgi:hypothetical protein